jgi:hypothetical protein
MPRLGNHGCFKVYIFSAIWCIYVISKFPSHESHGPLHNPALIYRHFQQNPLFKREWKLMRVGKREFAWELHQSTPICAGRTARTRVAWRSSWQLTGYILVKRAKILVSSRQNLNQLVNWRESGESIGPLRPRIGDETQSESCNTQSHQEYHSCGHCFWLSK